MTEIHVATERPYSIHIGRGILANLGGLARLEGRKALIVSDSNVAPLYLKRLEAVLDSIQGMAGHASVVLRAGEAGKNLKAVERVYRALDKADIGRSDILIALGGGVVGDIGGFAASSWNRGIGCLQIPTSLLAMSDSSAGGKTGVDYRLRKNAVGAFHQPEAVVIDLDFLDSLPPRQLSNGMAEVIKYGMIGDPELLKILSGADPDMEEVVARSLRVKVDIVQRDPTEKGERALLNFGHTYGHALEAHYRYRHWLHGEAVAIGMVFASPGPELEALLKRWALPLHDPRIDPRRLVQLMFQDKKRHGKILRFILVDQPGKAYIREMSRSDLEAKAQAALVAKAGAVKA